jgi:uncharacterized membrane protein YkvA (DUF1232 family)
MQGMNDDSILPFDDTRIEPLTERQIEQHSPDWYATWRPRIETWISQHADDEVAGIVLFVPDLLALVLRLARDKRVPFRLKGQLLLAAAYVLSPFDFMPEALLGVIGLSDDAGVLVLVLMWIQGITSVDPQVLRDNWSGSGDVIEVIERLHREITGNAERLFHPQVWQSIRRRFGSLRKRFTRPKSQ